MDCQVSEIVDRLTASYREVGGINNIDCSNLPSKQAIGLACEELLQILFPGFLDEGAVASSEIALKSTARVAQFLGRMKVEVVRSLRFKARANGGDSDRDATIERARAMVCDFLRALPDVRKLLRTDVEAAYEGDPAAQTYEEIILAYPCLEAIAIQRAAHLLYQAGLPLIPRMMTEWAHGKTGIDIHPGACIGSHFFIDHGTGVVIGETCAIGAHVKLYHGVTLGARSFPKDDEGKIVKGIKRHPNVEDDVTIYPNATILGGETTIGARSTIGANAFLMEGVPPDTLVALETGGHKLHSKPNAKERVAGVARS